MTELETLKDIIYEIQVLPEGAPKTKVIELEVLRQKAIKWIKDFNQREKNIKDPNWADKKLPVYIDEEVFAFADSGYDEYSPTAFGNIIAWIKHFFNIEEGDLK